MIEQQTEQETITLSVSVPVETHERLIGIARITDHDVSSVIELMTEFYGFEFVHSVFECEGCHERV